MTCSVVTHLCRYPSPCTDHTCPFLLPSPLPQHHPSLPFQLPPSLILHLVRFTKSNFLTQEKNRSVVTFPVKNLSLKDYYFPPAMEDAGSNASSSASASTSASSSSSSSSAGSGPPQPPSPHTLPTLSVAQLKEVITRWGTEAHLKDLGGVCERPALVELAGRACEWAAGALAAVAMVRMHWTVCVCVCVWLVCGLCVLCLAVVCMTVPSTDPFTLHPPTPDPLLLITQPLTPHPSSPTLPPILPTSHPQAKYDLIATVCHESSHGQEITVGVGSTNSGQSAATKGKGTGPGGAAVGAGAGAGAGGKNNSALDGHYRCHTQVLDGL